MYRWQLSLALLSLADAASLASEASYITGATCQRNFGGAESGGLAFGSPSPGFQNFHEFPYYLIHEVPYILTCSCQHSAALRTGALPCHCWRRWNNAAWRSDAANVHHGMIWYGWNRVLGGLCTWMALKASSKRIYKIIQDHFSAYYCIFTLPSNFALPNSGNNSFGARVKGAPSKQIWLSLQ